MEAIKLFHGEVSEDLLLKEKQFDGAADQAAARGGRLLRQAGGAARRARPTGRRARRWARPTTSWAS